MEPRRAHVRTAVVWLAAFASSLWQVSAQSQPPSSCGADFDRACRFSLCSRGGKKAAVTRSIPLRPPFAVANGPLICLQGSNDGVGFIKESGEPIVVRPNGSFNLSEWTPTRGNVALKPAFARNFFFTSKVPLFGKSGLSRKGYKGNQQLFMNNKCIKLPIVSYRVVNSNGKQKGTVLTGKSERDCVGFKTLTTRILVELEWTNNDDLDLRVTEPDGTVLSRFNPDTETGVFFNDDVPSGCFGSKKAGKEVVAYLSRVFGKVNNVQKGRYRVEVEHTRKCRRRRTPFFVRVTVDGIQKIFKKKTSVKGGGATIFSASFKL